MIPIKDSTDGISSPGKLLREPYERIEDKVTEITDFYQSLGQWQKLFFPSEFQKIMTRRNPPSSLIVARVLQTKTYFYHKVFFPSKLGAYFTSTHIATTRWLFDPQGIPNTQTGKAIENNLNELEQECATPEVNQCIEDFKKYFKRYFLVKFMVPTELRTLLESHSHTEPNHKIRLTLAVFNLPWYYSLLLNLFYPSMIKKFKTSPHIIEFHDRIKKCTILPGTLRVERNFQTLSDISKKAKNGNRQKNGKIRFSEKLDCDMANLISGLNHQGDLKSNLNAQIALDLIRLFGDARAEENDILYLCDALTLYFKNYPGNDGNEKLKQLVEDFKGIDGLLNVYTYLRQEHVGIFTTADPARNRLHLDAIREIGHKNDALITLEILSRHGLIARSNPNQQENFEKFITFEKNKKNRIDLLNGRLQALEAALYALSPTLQIEQRLYDFFISREATNQSIERITNILTLIHQSEESTNQLNYQRLMESLSAREHLGSYALSDYLAVLEGVLKRLYEQKQLNAENLKLLLTATGELTQVSSEISHPVSDFNLEPAEDTTPTLPSTTYSSRSTKIVGNYQQTSSYAMPTIVFAGAYLISNMLPILYNFISERKIPIAISFLTSALAVGYCHSSTLSNYAARIPKKVIPNDFGLFKNTKHTDPQNVVEAPPTYPRG